MNETLEFLVRHGAVVLFAAVFVEQIGIPLPAAPWLLATGALAGAGKMNWLPALDVATLGSLTRALLKRGYRVVGNSLTISQSKELKASSDLVLLDGDISKKETAIKVADAAITHFSRIDLFVNNPGTRSRSPNIHRRMLK